MDDKEIDGSPRTIAPTTADVGGTAKKDSTFEHLIARTSRNKPPNYKEPDYLRPPSPEDLAAIDRAIARINARQKMRLMEVDGDE